MKQLIFGLLAFAALAATSCSKDKGDKPTPTPGGGTATVQGNWAVSSVVTKEDGLDPATYQGKADDYYKFGTTGNVDVKVDDFVTTVAYEMVDATHINIGGDVEEIKVLTEHKLVLHSPATDEVPEDETITLTR